MRTIVAGKPTTSDRARQLITWCYRRYATAAFLTVGGSSVRTGPHVALRIGRVAASLSPKHVDRRHAGLIGGLLFLIAVGSLPLLVAAQTGAGGVGAVRSVTVAPAPGSSRFAVQAAPPFGGSAVVRQQSVPRTSPVKLAEEGLRRGTPSDPATAAGATSPDRRPPPEHPGTPVPGHELRLQMREYGERYGETSRERHENMEVAPSTARWLRDPERFQFREALRERYRQPR